MRAYSAADRTGFTGLFAFGVTKKQHTTPWPWHADAGSKVIQQGGAPLDRGFC